MITSHKELAKAIEGKKILHLNSLGKDAILCLDWLNNYAKPSKIISLFYELECSYPTDKKYLEYLKGRYPKTEFITRPNIPEANEKISAFFQSPLYINYVINNQEYIGFNIKKANEEMRTETGSDYICSGISCYEGMGRAIYIRRVGLMDEKNKTIYPIGLMKQAQVQELLKSIPTKLNPSYKYGSESFDTASYFKMHIALKCSKKFEKTVYRNYPMLLLDKYRYEVLFGKTKK